jgi:xylitol oxidase
MRERNWANNYTFKAGRIHRPVSVEEVRDLVARSSRIRAIGTRHSFNGIADSPRDLIDLSRLDPCVVIDGEKQTATVGAATSYGALANHLEIRGWALHNMASLPHFSVAGATATGTHGSGDKNGCLSTSVAALELITATGDLIKVGREDPGFDGMVVGLGALGIVTRVTLDIHPTFDFQQDAFANLSWTATLSNFDEIMSAAYSVSLMTKWSGATVNRLWLKRRTGQGSPVDVAAHLGVTPAPCASWTDTDDATAGLNPFGVPGPWSERLPHFRLGVQLDTEQIQSEYMLPRAHGVLALAKLHAIGDRIDRHLHITEIRTMAGTTYGSAHPTVTIAWGFISLGRRSPRRCARSLVRSRRCCCRLGRVLIGVS